MRWTWAKVFWLGTGFHVAAGSVGLMFWPDAPNLEYNAIGAIIGLVGVAFERLID